MRRFLTLFLAAFLTTSVMAQDATDQDGDRGLLARLIQGALSSDQQTVVIQGLEGALSSEATIDAIILSDPEGVFLRVEDVTLDWNRLALVRRRLDVNTLAIGRIVMIRRPLPDPAALPAPEASGFSFSLPELPVAVSVAELRLDSLELGETILGEPFGARFNGNAQIAEGSGQADLVLERTDGQELTATISASFAGETSVLSVDVGLD
ncbi:MAG: translocation/assembly module TamB, partial [Pseudomonadota bacterium]